MDRQTGVYIQWNIIQLQDFRRKFATAWVNLEDIMGSEIRQSQKENTTLFHWYEVLIITKLTEQRMQ